MLSNYETSAYIDMQVASELEKAFTELDMH